MRKLLLILMLLGSAGHAFAQDIISADRFTFNTGPQTLFNGSGTPEGSVTAPVGSFYWDNTTGNTYRKSSGTGNTGWVLTSTGGTVTSVAITGPTGISWTGSPITTAGTFSGTIASGYFLPNGGTAGQLLMSNGVSAPGWTTPTYPNTAASGTFPRGDGTNWLQSTLTLPNTMTANRVPFATSTNAIGDDADLTFLTDTLSATKVASSSLTSGRVPFATTAGLLVDDADLTFLTDTLSSTRLSASTSVATPWVYAHGAAGSAISMGGTGVNGCGTPPSVANCEAAFYRFDGVMHEQRLITDLSYGTQWYVAEDGGYLNAFSGTGYLPLKLSGAPVRIGGGGFHVGTEDIVDPGLGNSILDGFIGSDAYASQTTGWRITRNGSGDFQYLFANEMHVKKFIADVEIALLGGVHVTKSQAKIAEAFTVPAKGSISVLIVKDISDSPDAAVFESGDTVSIRQFSRSGGGLSVTNAHGVVTGYSDLADGKQSWNFQRYLSTEGGAMTDATVIPVDSLVLDFGVIGGGYYEINAADGLHAINSPYAQTVKMTCAAPIGSCLTVTTRLGNLRGITGATEYGLLAGTYGSTASGRYIIFSDQNAEIHNVPLSLYSGSNQTLYMNPVLSSFQQATNNASGLTYDTGTGCWSGIHAGVFKWRCGDMAGDFIAWNGSTLNVNGNITVTGLIASDTLAVDGVAAASVASGAALANLGLLANGNPSLPAAVSPSGAGLYLGSSHLGFYNSGWKTYMDNSGNFYLGGTSGALQFNGGTGVLTITGVVNITSGSVPNAAVTGLGSVALLNSVTLGTHTTGNYAGSTSAGGSANNTLAVGSQTQAAAQQAVIAANLALASNGGFLMPVVAAPSGSGLFLGYDYMGYYASGAWKSYIDNSGNFYLGGTGGKLRWNAGAGTLYIDGDGVFSGALSAATGTFAGALSAATGSFASGTIGGFTLNSTDLYAGSGSSRVQMQVGGGFWAGDTSQGSAPFSVTAAGALTATNATITSASGTVALSSGGIAITAGTTLNNSRSYRFPQLTLSDAGWGMYAYDNGTTRGLDLRNASASTGNIETSLLSQNLNDTASVTVRAFANATVAVVADELTATGAIVAAGNILTTGGLVGVTATTSNTGTVVVHAANGYYYDQSSSERVKHIWDTNWKPTAEHRATFLKQPSILFSYIANAGDPVIGFRAEGWQRADLPFMVNYDKHGNIASYRQDAFLVYTHDVQQDHEARIVALERELAQLKGQKP